MSDNVENLILEHLRVLRSEIQTMRTEMHTEFKDIKHRISSIENTHELELINKEFSSTESDIFVL